MISATLKAYFIISINVGMFSGRFTLIRFKCWFKCLHSVKHIDLFMGFVLAWKCTCIEFVLSINLLQNKNGSCFNSVWNVYLVCAAHTPDTVDTIVCSGIQRVSYSSLQVNLNFPPRVIGCTFKNKRAQSSVTAALSQLMCGYKDNSAFVRWWDLEIKQRGLIHCGRHETESHLLVLCHCSRLTKSKSASFPS